MGTKDLRENLTAERNEQTSFSFYILYVCRCLSLQRPYFHPDFIVDSGGVGGTASLETKTNIIPSKAKERADNRKM